MLLSLLIVAAASNDDEVAKEKEECADQGNYWEEVNAYLKFCTDTCIESYYKIETIAGGKQLKVCINESGCSGYTFRAQGNMFKCVADCESTDYFVPRFGSGKYCYQNKCPRGHPYNDGASKQCYTCTEAFRGQGREYWKDG